MWCIGASKHPEFSVETRANSEKRVVHLLFCKLNCDPCCGDGAELTRSLHPPFGF